MMVIMDGGDIWYVFLPVVVILQVRCFSQGPICLGGGSTLPIIF